MRYTVDRFMNGLKLSRRLFTISLTSGVKGFSSFSASLELDVPKHATITKRASSSSDTCMRSSGINGRGFFSFEAVSVLSSDFVAVIGSEAGLVDDAEAGVGSEAGALSKSPNMSSSSDIRNEE